MGISLIGPRFDNFPTLILVKIMPLSHFSCRDLSWLGYLIQDAYLHDDKLKTYTACPDIQSVTNLNPKHSITNQWRGLGL